MTDSPSDNVRRERRVIRQAAFAVMVIAILAAAIEVLVRIFAPTPRYHDPRFISNLQWDYPPKHARTAFISFVHRPE